jgi:hypothetical protein
MNPSDLLGLPVVRDLGVGLDGVERDLHAGQGRGERSSVRDVVDV